MKYFVYCRKSTDREDKQILSTEAQQRILLDYADKNRLSVVEVFVENQSAYKAGRPKFNDMLLRIEKGEAEAILTYHLTRLARNSFDGGRIIYMMDEEKITQIATPEKPYLDTPDDKFMMQIHFAMAKKSSDDTSQFVTRDIESKLLRGEFPGKAPIGYLNISMDGHIVGKQGDPEKEMLLLKLGRPLKRIEIDPIDGPLVSKLFEEAGRGGRSLSRLAKLSKEIGLRARKSGKPLRKSMMEFILKNPFYYGALPYMGKVHDTVSIQERSGNATARVQHEPLVSKDLFLKVKMTMFTRGTGRRRNHEFSFGNCLLTCGECGSAITAETHKGHVYYHCTRNKGPCSQKRSTREEELETQMTRLLSGLRLPQSYVDYTLENLRLVHRKEANFSDALRRKLQGQLNAGQAKLDALLQVKISPNNMKGEVLSDEEYIEQKIAIRRELESMKEQLASAQEESENWVEDCERFFRFTQRITERFGTGTAEDKKTLLGLVASNLALKNGKVAAVYREPYALLANFPLSGRSDGRGFEPENVAKASQKKAIATEWLPLLVAIRTYRLPLYASSLVE